MPALPAAHPVGRLLAELGGRRRLQAVLRAHAATPEELEVLRQGLLSIGIPGENVRRVLSDAGVMDWFFRRLRADPQDPRDLLMDLCDRLYVP
jgi:hypothetical protein